MSFEKDSKHSKCSCALNNELELKFDEKQSTILVTF